MPKDREKLVIVTRKTALEELIERFHTRDQARFYVEHMGASFDEYQEAHDAYTLAAESLRKSLPRGVRHQWVDRSFLPNFLFGETDLIVTLGQDGLVVNTAKYLAEQPVLALNPDASRYDGVLLPFDVSQAREALILAVEDKLPMRRVSMARVDLNDGQSLHAVNDFFIGPKSHGSARYRLRFRDVEEDQSSSGLIVSTGAGSTGWLRSILTGASGVAYAHVPTDEVAGIRDEYRFDWEAEQLVFTVREPFVSRTSSAEVIFDRIEEGEVLELISQMPQNGVIFSDGVEEDYLPFNSGAIAQVRLAERKLHLLVPSRPAAPQHDWR
jgi:NAD kinase